MIWNEFVKKHWLSIVKIIGGAVLALVVLHFVFKAFDAKTITVTRTVYDTTQVQFLQQQLELRDAQLAADTLAIQQFQNQVADVQDSKDSAIAFYEQAIRDLKDSTHPGSIIIPKATATKVFDSKDANGIKYSDTVTVVYNFPPLNSFELSLLLAPRTVITSHQETSTITTVQSKLPDLFIGPALTTHSLFGGVAIRAGNHLVTFDYRIATWGWVPSGRPLDNVMASWRYKIF